MIKFNKEFKHVECRHSEFYEKIDPSEKNDISVSGRFRIKLNFLNITKNFNQFY